MRTLSYLCVLLPCTRIDDSVVARESSLVNTYISGYQLNPSIASLVNGGYVIVWESADQDGSQYGIYGQIFHADGSKNGNEFRVNVTTNYQQSLSKL